MNKLDNSSGYIIVAQSDGLSSSSSSTLIAIPAPSISRQYQSSSMSVSTSRPVIYTLSTTMTSSSSVSTLGLNTSNASLTPSSASQLLSQRSTTPRLVNSAPAPSSQINFVQITDNRSGSVGLPMDGMIRIGAMPSSAKNITRTQVPPQSFTKPVTIRPSASGEHAAFNNVQNLTTSRTILVPTGVGAVSKLTVNQLPASNKFAGHSITLHPANVTRSPQKAVPLQPVATSNVTAMWKSPNTQQNGVNVATTPLSPSKLIIQINSNQLPLLTGTMQQTQPRPLLPATNQSRVTNQSMQSISGTTSVNNAQFVRYIPHGHQKGKQPLALSAPSSNRTKTLVPVHHNHTSKSHTSTTQRLILPATPHLHMNMAGSNVYQTLPSSAAGSTVAFIGQPLNATGGYAFVQTPVVSQPSVNHHSHPQPSHPPVARQLSASYNNSSDFTASKIYAARQLQYTMDAAGNKSRKPCNCTKSQCLKLYCECFANGEFCSDCNCCNCSNNLEHEDERSKAIKSCIDRNPHAFHPKIGKGGNSRQHSKGCNCKRSGCLKNYCECYEAKISCSNLCRCVGCRNVEENSERQTLLQLADAAEVRVQQQTAADVKLSTQIFGHTPVRPQQPPSGAERPAYTFVTLEVVEAMCSCLIAAAEDGESLRRDDVDQERHLLEEFGRCLTQVIDTAGRTRAVSPND